MTVTIPTAVMGDVPDSNRQPSEPQSDALAN